ncbi:antA/AntB antirepressor family protein [Clostridium paraputrificum]|uniref:antA/AntB antirepressor family protein n=1 Tax=Clostridium paraputrificum TaxID=29363 RepID=UPI00374E974D
MKKIEEVIKVEINEKGQKLVSARDLYYFLEVKSRFNDWINNRIKKYEYQENIDYVCLTKNLVTQTKAGREGIAKEIDYAITLEMAKELSMVENNKKGKEARKYFISMEREVTLLKEENKKLYDVATSSKELKEREYEANKIRYSLRNVKQLLLDADYTILEDTINTIIDVHINLRKEDRYKYYQEMSSTEYKQHIRDYVYNKLGEAMQIKCLEDNLYTTVAFKIRDNLSRKLLETHRRATSKYINNISKELNNYKERFDIPTEELFFIPIHGFSCNYMYANNKRTSAYNKWIMDFPRDIIYKELLEDMGVDFSKEIEVNLAYKCKAEFDIENFNKATIDMLFNRILGVDDKVVTKINAIKWEECSNYNEGCICVNIRNRK